MAVAGFLRVRFVDDFDGSGELIAHAESGGFSGNGRAYFNIEEIKTFADAIAGFPLSDSSRPSISGGCGSLNGPEHAYQEHLGHCVPD